MQSVCQSVCLSVCLSAYLSSAPLYARPSLNLSVSLSMSMFVFTSVCFLLTIRLFVYLSCGRYCFCLSGCPFV